MSFNPPKLRKMTATNIDIDEFINVLTQIQASGVRLVNLEMLTNDDNPALKKLIIHPIKNNGNGSYDQPQNTRRLIVKNPDISTDNDDIFDTFKGLL